MLVVDLGQSGSRIRYQDQTIISKRGKLLGEEVIDSLRAVFSELPTIRTELVALSCSGFNGVVKNPQAYGVLCKEFFGADKVAVMDDGLAGYEGALHGQNGVALTLGGGVVAVGGRNGKFAHRDGLGSTFGDEGGGFWLGKFAIAKALAIRQGRGEDQAMLEYFTEECSAFDALDNKSGSDAATLAINTARKVLEAADAGIPTAISIVNEGALLLAHTVTASWTGCNGTEAESPNIVIQGGLAKNASYVEKISRQVRSQLPSAIFVNAASDNLDGATWVVQNLEQDAPPLLMWSGL